MIFDLNPEKRLEKPFETASALSSIISGGVGSRGLETINFNSPMVPEKD